MLIVIINALLINLNYICELINGASDSQKKKKKKKKLRVHQINW